MRSRSSAAARSSAVIASAGDRGWRRGLARALLGPRFQFQQYLAELGLDRRCRHAPSSVAALRR